MNILFVSRAYPPIVGGIENQNSALSQWLPKSSHTHTLANTRGKKFLPIFLPYALLYCLWSLRRYDCLLLGDGVLALVGFAAKLCYPKKKVVSNIHGLDLTFKNFIYQSFWVKLFLPFLDGYIAVSRETKAMGIRAGLKERKITIIPNGVDEPAETGFSRADLSSLLNQELTENVVLLTAGRLVARKGVYWFIESVLPKLPAHVLYVVSGDGPERARIEKFLSQHPNLAERVSLLGYVSEHDKEILLQTIDIFVQPNIPVANDVEGFGIAVIEATLRGRPTVASALEGLQDAVTDGENGLLVPPKNAEAWTNTLLTLINAPEKRTALGSRARSFTQKHYHWSIIGKRYTDYLASL